MGQMTEISQQKKWDGHIQQDIVVNNHEFFRFHFVGNKTIYREMDGSKF